MKYQICVSGAAKGESVEEGRKLAAEVGRAIAVAGHTLLTGATSGLPDESAAAYKKHKGAMSLGISPASSKVEHVLKYRLPTDHYDAILYTGLHYIGRDALLINSADAVVSIGGRLGTLHEFTIAVETETPIALLQGAGGISNEIKEILHAAQKGNHSEYIIFEESADILVAKLTEILDKLHQPYKNLYS